MVIGPIVIGLALVLSKGNDKVGTFVGALWLIYFFIWMVGSWQPD